MKVVSFHRTLHEVTVEAVTVEVPADFDIDGSFDMPEAWADGAYAVHSDIIDAGPWVYEGEVTVDRPPKGGDASAT